MGINDIKDNSSSNNSSVDKTVTGYDELLELVRDLEGRFTLIDELNDSLYRYDIHIDISDYREKLADIFSGPLAEARDEINSSIAHDSVFQDDLEKFVLGSNTMKKVRSLINEFKKNIDPLYDIYKLFKDIDKQIKENKDVNSVISSTTNLIDSVSSIKIHDDENIIKILEKAYETIYNAMIYEASYGRNDIVMYQNTNGVSSTREGLGTIFRREIKKMTDSNLLSREELDKYYLKHRNEGLGTEYSGDKRTGNDFVDSDMVNLIVEAKKTSKKEERNKEIDRVTNKYNESAASLASEYKSLVNELKEVKNTLFKLAVTKTLKFISKNLFIVFPITLLTSGLGVGGYKTLTTKEYAIYSVQADAFTGDIIYESPKEYDDDITNYVSSISICTPWEKSVGYDELGFVRKNYVYALEDNFVIEEGTTFDEAIAMIKNSYTFKGVYLQHKNQLNSQDSMEHGELILTYSKQDFTDSRPAYKYTLYGLGVGSALAAAYIVIYYIYKRKFSRRRRWRNYSNDDDSVEREYDEALREKNRIITDLNNLGDRVDDLRKDISYDENKYDIKLNIKLPKSGLGKK